MEPKVPQGAGLGLQGCARRGLPVARRSLDNPLAEEAAPTEAPVDLRPQPPLPGEEGEGHPQVPPHGHGSGHELRDSALLSWRPWLEFGTSLVSTH